MIHAVLIDEDRQDLMKLKLMLDESKSVAVAATYTNPSEAIHSTPQWEPDVIFVDIDMPKLNGLKTAELLQKSCPESHIVFVSVSKQYAYEAFDLNALDFILKPVKQERLLKTIQRLEALIMKKSKSLIPAKTMIRLFQSLRIERGEQPYFIFRWRTLKAQELFAFLLHNRNRFVSKDTLIDLLWPESEPKKASTHLYTTIYQVRQSLMLADTDVQITNVSGGEGYKLDLGTTLTDVQEWEEGIFGLTAIATSNYAEHQRLFDFYSGDYFGDYDYIWAESERQRLRTIWLHHAIELADFYINSDKVSEAVTIYQKVVQLQPYFEQGHLGLMKVYDKIGERSAVEEQYRILTQLLTQELHIKIPPQINGWYEHWQQRNNMSIL